MNTTVEVLPNTTHQTAVLSEALDLNSLPLSQARLWMNRVVVPLIVVLGLLGNTMILATCRRLHARRSSMDQYLMVIAVTDSLVLLSTSLTRWLELVAGVSLTESHDALCKMMNLTYNASGAITAWLLVAMTTQRAMSVVWPHRVSVLCTSRRSWQVIVMIVVFVTLLYSHLLYGVSLTSLGHSVVGTCTITSLDYLTFVLNVWVYVDLVVTSFFPFAVLLLANTVLIWKLRSSAQHATDRLGADPSQQASRSSEALSISLTVIALSLTFVVLTCPSMINNTVSVLYRTQGAISDTHQYALNLFLESLFNVFVYLNHALNFYLYCLTGARFRKEFSKMVWVWRSNRG
ncbi:thyrotropin-releasing hormone receptor-like [Littorina saxatilis]|uniref:thyrotropin-releasing hormone receptor-like n=1 Tax=Littorina saxatilis TaxID=31220 RepID=UPI0038B50227